MKEQETTYTKENILAVLGLGTTALLLLGGALTIAGSDYDQQQKTLDALCGGKDRPNCITVESPYSPVFGRGLPVRNVRIDYLTKTPTSTGTEMPRK